MMQNLISIGQAAFLLGVCTKTLRRWDKNRVLTPICRTAGNHRRYDKVRILEMVRKRKKSHSIQKYKSFNESKVAIYARVSSSKQKKRGDLDRQIEKIKEYCTASHDSVYKVYKDVGSGLNDKRNGLMQLLKDVSKGKFDKLIVNYSDRLSRFGTRIIQAYLQSWGVSLKIIHPVVIEGDCHAELVTDLTAILYSFMGKLYRMRRTKKKEKREKT